MWFLFVRGEPGKFCESCRCYSGFMSRPDKITDCLSWLKRDLSSTHTNSTHWHWQEVVSWFMMDLSSLLDRTEYTMNTVWVGFTMVYQIPWLCMQFFVRPSIVGSAQDQFCWSGFRGCSMHLGHFSVAVGTERNAQLGTLRLKKHAAPNGNSGFKVAEVWVWVLQFLTYMLRYSKIWYDHVESSRGKKEVYGIMIQKEYKQV